MPLFRRRRAAPEILASSWADEHAKEAFTYELLMMRELEQDSMLWQTPALAMTAQAFLLTVAFDSGASVVARAVTAGLGVVVAFLSMQLMAKHRFLEELDREKMREFESALGIAPLAKREWAYRDGRYIQTKPVESRWAKHSSYKVWQRGLLLFIAADVAALVWAVLENLG